MRPSWRWAARALCVALLLPSPARSDEHAEPSACPFLDARCPERLPYRPIDGTCNNLAQPWMGRAKSPTLRLLPAAYSHEHAGRLSQAGTPLPSAQVIASRLMPQEDHQGVTSHLFVLWAQVVSHDFAMRAAPKNSVTGPCCGKNAGKNCIAIPVPEDDPFYSQFNLTCLPMGRTNTTTCSSREPDTMSGSTHFLDASFIYGSNKDTMKRLRQLEGGLLRVRDTPEGPFPPNVANPAAVCGQEPCYDTGDPRTNQTPMLAAIQTLWLREHNRVARALAAANPPLSVRLLCLQTLWLREHNRVARALAAANPRWSDEVLFQEARRIVVAEWQVITFRDWLPWLLGPERVDSLRLAPRGASPASEYDPAVDPRTANEVTTAAFRALHSMVQGRFWVGRHGARTERISDWLLNPGPILEHEDGLLDVLQGMSYQQSQDQDRWMDNEISQQYEPIRTADGRRMGHNLIAVDIQRGRDHALPGYVAFRKYVGLPVAKDFGDLSDVLSEQDIQALRDIYEHVSDVDLYVGGLMERRKKGASLFGPTFQALLEDQFWRWRYADRFFFNFLGLDHSLNQDQILSLENTSVSRLFCDNVKGFKYVPQDAFVKAVHNNNEDVSCELLPKVDLTLWKDVKHGYLFPLSPITFPS